ncbi:MAG: DUF4239 domain-containing protein [Gemmatimonadales bacterium]
MSEMVSGAFFSLTLFIGLIIAIEGGRRIRHHSARHDGATGLGTIESAVFGMLALLLAFSFNGAASRFDVRRQLVVDEVNAISSAHQRLDLLTPEARSKLHTKFQQYVDARLETYKAVPDTKQVNAWNAKAVALQDEIWTDAVTAVQTAPAPTIAAQLLTAISSMTDAATSRGAASFIHPPAIIYFMLGLIAILAALMAGYAMGASDTRSWLHIIGFAAVLAIMAYVIVDLEYPRLGRFQIVEFDRMLADLRAGMR